jgi:hypothetical protein
LIGVSPFNRNLAPFPTFEAFHLKQATSRQASLFNQSQARKVLVKRGLHHFRPVQ